VDHVSHDGITIPIDARIPILIDELLVLLRADANEDIASAPLIRQPVAVGIYLTRRLLSVYGSKPRQHEDHCDDSGGRELCRIRMRAQGPN
jgi:hypothetical protein